MVSSYFPPSGGHFIQQQPVQPKITDSIDKLTEIYRLDYVTIYTEFLTLCQVALQFFSEKAFSFLYFATGIIMAISVFV